MFINFYAQDNARNLSWKKEYNILSLKANDYGILLGFRGSESRAGPLTKMKMIYLRC